jgi:hypothetical protein
VVITTKSIRRTITGEGPGKLDEFCEAHGARIGHYGNLRGSNAFKDCDALVILGRQQPAPEEIEDEAKAYWYDTAKPLRLIKPVNGRKFLQKKLRAYLMKDGLQPKGEVQLHPDPRCQAVLAMSRENEMIQAIDRARLIWGEPKDVFILCDIPLPGVEIDRLVTWDALRGADRLSQAIEACAAGAKNALPLVPAYLAATYPKLWKTENAAKMWLKTSPEIRELREKGPLSNIKTMRQRTLLLEYRLAGGAGRWSTALVFAPDAQAAIANALGVPEVAVELK